LLGEKMSKAGGIGDGVPVTYTGGSGQSSPSGEGNPLKPPTPRSSNVDELTSELKVLKLQEKIAMLKMKLKNKKMKIQEVSSLSSSNEESNNFSSDDECNQVKKGKGKGKKKNGSKPSYNTTSFNYDSLPTNHSFTSVHIGKTPHFDGMNYAK
jgi:hypothetical protein